jgi:hypothetical protein
VSPLFPLKQLFGVESGGGIHAIRRYLGAAGPEAPGVGGHSYGCRQQERTHFVGRNLAGAAAKGKKQVLGGVVDQLPGHPEAPERPPD